MTKKVRVTIIAVIVLLIAGMALFPVVKRTFFGTGDEEAASVRPVRNSGPLNVNASILRYKSLADAFISYGRLLPDEEVDLSFETSGMITDIFFKEGSFVKKGDLLAKVNDKPLQAELKKLQTQVPLAEARVSRQQTLLEKDAVSQESYESVTTELEKLKADIELVKARLAQTELRAPFEGMIGLRMVSEGAYATPSTLISTLTKITPLKLEFSVNEKQVNEIKPGTVIEFTTATDLDPHQATVYAVESRLDRSTVSLKARALYPNPGGKLKPGQYASLNMSLTQYGTALVIPSMAMVAEMGRDIVYVYNNGVAKQVSIVKGMRTESAVQVIDGLQPGDTLITTGVMQLRDGMPVTIGILGDGAENANNAAN